MSLDDDKKNERRNADITAEERQVYIKLIQDKYPDIDPDTVILEPDGDFVNIQFKKPRRIFAKMGGTLIGDPETWNDAKRAEYYDTLPNPLE